MAMPVATCTCVTAFPPDSLAVAASPRLVLEITQQPGDEAVFPAAMPGIDRERAVSAVERKVLVNRGHQAGLLDGTRLDITQDSGRSARYCEDAEGQCRRSATAPAPKPGHPDYKGTPIAADRTRPSLLGTAAQADRQRDPGDIRHGHPTRIYAPGGSSRMVI